MSYPYPAPPRRSSRSRSPSRGSYSSRPPVPEAGQGYPPDVYRGDWDMYDRDRAYYDRYDYGPRRRSRSPTVDETSSKKRRRSFSPYDRDRYEPRPRYDDYDGPRYGYSPSRGGRPPYQSGRRGPPDPRTFEYPASLKAYAEWFRYYYPQEAIDEDNADKAAEQAAGDGSKPRNGIRARWEKYKKDFAATQLQTMFEHHRKSPWFAEKYDPAQEFQDLRSRVRKIGWKGHVQTFLVDLEAGKFDPPLTESPANASNETEEATSPVKENGEGEDNEEPEQDDGGALGGGGGNKSGKQDNRGEEVTVLNEGNQITIRTLPPDIGRVKLENALDQIPGYVYLALGDPLQKRNYYRAGWLKFSEDADMPAVMTELTEKKIDGFKLHVSHSGKEFTSRTRYAPEVASRPDRLEKDLANVKVLAGILEEQAAALRKFKPPPPKDDAPKSEGDVDASMEESQQPVEDEEEEEPHERGSDAVERRIEKIMADLREQGLVDVNDERAYELGKTTVTLDMYLAYLRAAYHTCYYCCVVTDHVEELHRKCIKHKRRPLSKALLEELKEEEEKKKRELELEDQTMEEKEKKTSRDWKRNDERWVDWLDTKTALLINRDGVDPREYGGKSYDEELSKAVEPYVKQEDEGKFRCKTCLKLFKATSFVEKHIANKHPEHVKGLEDIPYFNNFILDPHRIQPFSHPPQPVGNNSSQAPPQAYGIQAPAHREDRYDTRNGGGYYYPAPPGFRDDYRRDEATTARRLSDRIAPFAESAGLPAKPTASALDAPLSSGNSRNSRGAAAGGNGSRQNGGPPPPPPPDAKEDPRAAAGRRVSYHDMDLVAEGDVELNY